MKFNAVAAVSAAALLAGNVHAEEAKDAEASSVTPKIAAFTPTSIKADFLEQFTDDWETRWKPSHAKKETDGEKEDEEWAYVGEWSVEEPSVFKGVEGDKGLVVKNPAAHHAISAKFPKAIDNKGKTLVVQYEVKLQNGLECVSSPPTAKIVKTTELYTLIVKPDNTYIIKQNNEQVKTGSLLEDFFPPVNPPAEIEDPKDRKPDTWVDEARIADPEAKKPEDWDEEAPFEILDEEAQKPEDWDEEEDGDWLAPTPMKRNPDYKGKWTAPFIDNPDYKGIWAPRKIKNPDFFEDKTPANFEPIGAIGFEIWTMQSDILFDNIYVGHSIEDAEKLAEETFKPKHAVEKSLEEAAKPKQEEKPASPSDLKFTDDPVTYVKAKVDLFVTIAQKDPIEAIKFVPEVAGGFAALFATLLVLIASFAAGGGSAAPAVKKAAGDAKAAAKDVKDKATKAAASGAETVKQEANKRTTRSQS
ncbi:Calnexin like protein [Verticillium longisporum]|nr:Calnexin like protein [Verticillium longisporum]